MEVAIVSCASITAAGMMALTGYVHGKECRKGSCFKCGFFSKYHDLKSDSTVEHLLISASTTPPLGARVPCAMDNKPAELRYAVFNGEVLMVGQTPSVDEVVIALGGAVVMGNETVVTVAAQHPPKVSLHFSDVQEAKLWYQELQQSIHSSPPGKRIDELVEHIFAQEKQVTDLQDQLMREKREHTGAKRDLVNNIVTLKRQVAASKIEELNEKLDRAKKSLSTCKREKQGLQRKLTGTVPDLHAQDAANEDIQRKLNRAEELAQQHATHSAYLQQRISELESQSSNGFSSDLHEKLKAAEDAREDILRRAQELEQRLVTFEKMQASCVSSEKDQLQAGLESQLLAARSSQNQLQDQLHAAMAVEQSLRDQLQADVGLQQELEKQVQESQSQIVDLEQSLSVVQARGQMREEHIRELENDVRTKDDLIMELQVQQQCGMQQPATVVEESSGQDQYAKEMSLRAEDAERRSAELEHRLQNQTQDCENLNQRLAMMAKHNDELQNLIHELEQRCATSAGEVAANNAEEMSELLQRCQGAEARSADLHLQVQSLQEERQQVDSAMSELVAQKLDQEQSICALQQQLANDEILQSAEQTEKSLAEQTLKFQAFQEATDVQIQALLLERNELQMQLDRAADESLGLINRHETLMETLQQQHHEKCAAIEAKATRAGEESQAIAQRTMMLAQEHDKVVRELEELKVEHHRLMYESRQNNGADDLAMLQQRLENVEAHALESDQQQKKAESDLAAAKEAWKQQLIEEQRAHAVVVQALESQRAALCKKVEGLEADLTASHEKEHAPSIDHISIEAAREKEEMSKFARSRAHYSSVRASPSPAPLKEVPAKSSRGGTSSPPTRSVLSSAPATPSSAASEKASSSVAPPLRGARTGVPTRATRGDSVRSGLSPSLPIRQPVRADRPSTASTHGRKDSFNSRLQSRQTPDGVGPRLR